MRTQATIRENLSTNEFIQLEQRHRNSALPLVYEGLIDNVPVWYEAFRLEVTRFDVGFGRSSYLPVEPIKIALELRQHIRKAIIASRNKVSPF